MPGSSCPLRSVSCLENIFPLIGNVLITDFQLISCVICHAQSFLHVPHLHQCPLDSHPSTKKTRKNIILCPSAYLWCSSNDSGRGSWRPLLVRYILGKSLFMLVFLNLALLQDWTRLLCQCWNWNLIRRIG